MKVLAHILFYNTLDMETLKIELEENKKLLVSVIREALKENGEKEIEIIVRGDFYEFYLSCKIFKDIDETLVDFLLKNVDSERTACYVIDSKELEDTQ